MAKTHEEWFVGVKQKWEVERGETRWTNACIWYNGSDNKRYVGSEEEARAVLENAYRHWNGDKTYNEKGERYTTHEAGCIGIATVHTKETDDDMVIVEHIIKKRTVTEWETIEKE